ncbi:MAG: YggS family pyridoxal phosphate-dependent enzyme [Polyangiales bacterium]
MTDAVPVVDATRIAQGLKDTRARIDEACRLALRDPAEVSLMAVSKRQPVEAMRAAFDAGQRCFGENYVQELVEKVQTLGPLEGLQLHLIGHLQRNKVRAVVAARAAVDTVDSLRLLDALGDECARKRIVLPICVQVNVAGEPQKSGCAPGDLEALVSAARRCEAVRLEGLMAVPPAETAEQARPHFRALRELAREHGLSTLSMGMSADLEVAVAEGATCVRVGTAIFGARS